MTFIAIALLLLVAVIVLLRLRNKPDAPPVAPRRSALRAPDTRSGEATTVPLADDAPPVAAPRSESVPAELADFKLVLADELAQARQQAVVKVFRDIPRPPKLLQHLLSPDFVGSASSAQLVDLIAGEPLIAAKVLATVNSPRFGLASPVQSIAQAVMYLGLQSVRSVCLQYILIASFKPDGPDRKKILDATWTASAVASELIQNLSKDLAFEEPGALVSAVVLSFLGRLATASATPRGLLAQIPSHGFLDRVKAEQARLGLCSAEIGRLLMMEWGLPGKIAADAADVDRMLVTPPGAVDRQRATRLALCYLCARLGERLAGGQLAEPAAFEFNAEAGPDFFHLRGHLGETLVERLTGLLRAPELGGSVQRILLAMQEGAALQ